MMKNECPYCHNEMELGKIEAPATRMMFSKANHSSMFTEKCVHDGEIMLAKTKLHNVMLDAYICRSCNKIIIQL